MTPNAMAPIYEQIDESGLYVHVGDIVHGRFVKAARPAPLRTIAEWRVAPPMPRTPAPTANGWQELLRIAEDWARLRTPRTPRVQDENPYWPGVPLPPETTALVVDEQRKRGRRP